MYSISIASNVSRYSTISAVSIQEKGASSAFSSSGRYRTGQSVSSWSRHQGPKGPRPTEDRPPKQRATEAWQPPEILQHTCLFVVLIRSFQLHCKFKHKEGFQTFGTECILSNSRLLSIICRLEGCFPLYFLQLEFYTVRLFFHERRCSSLLPFSPPSLSRCNGRKGGSSYACSVAKGNF